MLLKRDPRFRRTVTIITVSATCFRQIAFRVSDAPTPEERNMRATKTMLTEAYAEQDESDRELSADELDHIAGGWRTETGCASSTKHPDFEIVIGTITVTPAK
jgi:hypothetical protein